MYTIETARLGFVPLSADIAEAALRSEYALADALGHNVADGLIEPVHKERVLPIRLEKLKKNSSVSQWYGFIIEKESRTAIGTMGFKNPPDETGLIEIGYGLHPSYRGKGYASEMAQTLKEWAFRQPGVTGITATGISKDNTASVHVVEQLGMTLVQENVKTVDYAIYK